MRYDLATATDWEYDLDFLNIIEEFCRKNKILTYLITPRNYRETLYKIKNNELKFGYFFDRASDTSPEYWEMQSVLQKKGVEIFEPIDLISWSSDKATMHLEFISAGLNTPYTIILPPYDSDETGAFSPSDLARLGRSFIIKPANTTGGGIGVVDGAEGLHEILTTRQEFKSDKYLIQEKVMPQEKDGKRFWFRGFFCCGKILCSWWNDTTHVYDLLSEDEIQTYSLSPLFDIVKTISRICKLRFFSTEIALSASGKFIVIDYVNPSCDMRLKSKCFDGVPDEFAAVIAKNIVSHVNRYMSSLKGRKL